MDNFKVGKGKIVGFVFLTYFVPVCMVQHNTFFMWLRTKKRYLSTKQDSTQESFALCIAKHAMEKYGERRGDRERWRRKEEEAVVVRGLNPTQITGPSISFWYLSWLSSIHWYSWYGDNGMFTVKPLLVVQMAWLVFLCRMHRNSGLTSIFAFVVQRWQNWLSRFWFWVKFPG